MDMKRQWLIVGIVALVLVVTGGLLYTMWQTESVTSPITGPERAEEARGIVSEIEKSAPSGADGRITERSELDDAFERAQEFQRKGQLADAQLLYFFGARNDHGPSAFALATMNDPNHHSPQTSLLPEPDGFQAYRWYTVARDQGVAEAPSRLDALHVWAMKAAAEGDQEAERLLLQWE